MINTPVAKKVHGDDDQHITDAMNSKLQYEACGICEDTGLSLSEKLTAVVPRGTQEQGIISF